MGGFPGLKKRRREMYIGYEENQCELKTAAGKRAVGDGYASAGEGLWPVGHLLAATFGILSILWRGSCLGKPRFD